eukprot:scaffold8085_cov127-Isochrysis_galbana.AAC.9
MRRRLRRSGVGGRTRRVNACAGPVGRRGRHAGGAPPHPCAASAPCHGDAASNRGQRQRGVRVRACSP